MIEKIPFGRTGHNSSRIIFGGASLGAMKQDRADATLAKLARVGVNHIDVAASYGDAELRLAPFLATRRTDYFLATKTGLRTKDQALAQLTRSLERLQVDQVDLIQMHNLTNQAEWEVAMGPGGALEGLVEAREQGLVRFIGVTGHGTYCPSMHIQSLEAFDFDSVLVPYNFSMMQNPQYAAEFDALYDLCQTRQVAMQTIKSNALRRWRDDDREKRYSWYKPITAGEPLKRSVDFVLARPGLFLNSTSNATILDGIFAAANEPVNMPSSNDMAADAKLLGIEPLFVKDVSDEVILAGA
ncbi:MAG: aldo/keto reductase [Gammaproteobacteria bacterium]|nr:aldo/keto reductase [Gammaproteobacteria bacterium]